jgi:UDP-N-acetylglucosamine--N-acetylmuramyl-(pentapeptide) pyrophosphoryl-undecaprenol N-acetylglucosamine transferase
MKIKILISAGGTGGHIFPALSVANELKRINPDIEILFVGANGKMEMEKVPQAGYKIIGLPVKGMPRKLSLKMFSFVFSLLKSWLQARKIVKNFKPNVAAGFGGYASGPVLHWAARLKISTLIQEQNSFAGKTNKLLSKKAAKICVSYNGMEKFFPKSKIIFTGNPIRKQIFETSNTKTAALNFFSLDSEKLVVLALGGSLGARSINNQILENLDWFENSNIQLLWQTGKLYYGEMVEKSKSANISNVKIHQFIERMDMAYLAADIIVSRAGAGTVSELCVAGKPVILIPSPNVAEDHQTHNARALSEKQAAILLPDNDLQMLTKTLNELINDSEKRQKLSDNIKTLAIDDANTKIANEILNLISK